jgi:dihydroorotase
VKSYPRGVTTNSDGGIESYETYYPVFKAMEEEDMVLNLHGEIPSDPITNTHVLNAEPLFLPHLYKLHSTFPRLRIVLEHATTRSAVDAVKACGPTVGCTITAHHLALTVDDWAGQSWNYCKPVAKFPDDRQALRDVIKEGEYNPPNLPHLFMLNGRLPGHPRFFLGSDSAPHPPQKKSTSSPTQGCAAGIYTSPILLPLVADLLESFGALDKLQGFVSTFGRRFYREEVAGKAGVDVGLRKVVGGFKVPESYSSTTGGGESVVPFWAGKTIGWEIVH